MPSAGAKSDSLPDGVNRAMNRIDSVRLVGRVTVEHDRRSEVLEFEGVVDFERKRSMVSMKSPEGDVTRMFRDPDAMYMDIDDWGGPIPQRYRTKEWVRIETTPTGSPGDAISQLDRTMDLERLGKRGRVDQIATGTVDGAATTRYRIIVPNELFAPDAPAPVAAFARDRAQAPPKQREVIDVWIDDERRVRRLVDSVTAVDGPDRTRLTYVMNLRAFDQPVHIRIPDPFWVVDSEDLSGANAAI